MSDTAPRTQHEFDYERLGILSTAVGIARLQLRDGEPEAALATLDLAAAKTRALHRAFLVEAGYSDVMVDHFLGIAS